MSGDMLKGQSDISTQVPLPVQNASGNYSSSDVSAETVVWKFLSGTAWAAAVGQAAGTICTAPLAYSGITNSIKKAGGSYNDTSLSFAAATRASTKMPVPDQIFTAMQFMSPTDQAAEIAKVLKTAGDYAIDHRRGQLWLKSLATVANDSVSYSFFFEPDVIEGIRVTKTNTCNGNGAQTDNLFALTGTVKVLAVWGECKEATEATVLSNNSLALYDGTATVEITDGDAPVDLSGITAGDVVYKSGAAASVALTFLNNSAGNVSEPASVVPIYLQKKSGVATYVRHLFTGNADTDVDMKWTIFYLPISDDGALVAV